MSNNTADICVKRLAATNVAVVIAVQNFGVGVDLSHDTAATHFTFDLTHVIAVLYDRFAGCSRYAANVLCTADSALVVAILRGTVVKTSNQAADEILATQIGIHHADVLYRTAAGVAEQTDVIYGTVVKIQTADRVSVAIEDARVFAVRAADGRPYLKIRAVAVQRAVLGQHVFVDRDVGGQNRICRRVLSDRRMRSVHDLRKFVQIVRSCYFVIACALDRSRGQATCGYHAKHANAGRNQQNTQ